MRAVSLIVGARFRPPAADVLNNLPGETALVLVREPENPHDPNAIKVCMTVDPGKDPDRVDLINGLVDGEEYPETWQLDWMTEPYHFHLGYIPREEAEVLAPIFDEKGGPIQAKLMFNLDGRAVVEYELDPIQVYHPTLDD